MCSMYSIIEGQRVLRRGLSTTAPYTAPPHRLLETAVPWLDELNSAAWSFPGAVVAAVSASAAGVKEPSVFLHLFRFTASAASPNPPTTELRYESGSSYRPRDFQMKSIFLTVPRASLLGSRFVDVPWSGLALVYLRNCLTLRNGSPWRALFGGEFCVALGARHLPAEAGLLLYKPTETQLL